MKIVYNHIPFAFAEFRVYPFVEENATLTGHEARIVVQRDLDLDAPMNVGESREYRPAQITMEWSVVRISPDQALIAAQGLLKAIELAHELNQHHLFKEAQGMAMLDAQKARRHF